MASNLLTSVQSIPAPPSSSPNIDSWTPCAGWPAGLPVTYAVSFFNSGYETARSPWTTGDQPSAMATLSAIPVDPSGNATGRNIYRQLLGFEPQLIASINDNTTATYQDTQATLLQRTLNIDSRLLEDYLHTDDVMVDSTQKQPLAVFLNNGQTEALVIDQTGNLCHVYREPLSDSGWNMSGLGAQVGAIGGDAIAAASCAIGVWAVSKTDASIWQALLGRWSPAPSLPVNVEAMDIAVGTDGIVRILDSNSRNVYEYAPGSSDWQRLDCGGMNGSFGQAPRGSANNLWAIDMGKMYIATNASGSWTDASPLPNNGEASVTVGTDGSVFGYANSTLYQYSGSEQWTPVSGTPAGFSQIVALNASSMWALTSSGILEFSNGSWQNLPSPPETPQQISAGTDGSLWCLCNGTLWQYLPATASWLRIMQPTGMPGSWKASEVVAGNDSEGYPHAFFTTTTSGEIFYCTYQANAGWGEPQGTGKIGGWLGLTNQQDTRELIAWASSIDGNLLVASESSNFSISEVKTGVLYSPSDGYVKVQLTAASANEWFTACVYDNQLAVAWGTAAAPLGTGLSAGALWSVNAWLDGKSISPTPSASQVIRLPWVQSENTFYAAVVDDTGNVYIVFNIVNLGQPPYGPSGVCGCYNLVTGSGTSLNAATTVGAVIDSTNMPRLYATDANNQLWVIRQTSSAGSNNDNPWTWTQWHPLGDDCTYMANGPGPLATSEFWTLDNSNFLNVLSQNPVSSNWETTQITIPVSVTAEPYYVAQYVTEVAVLNSNSTAAPGIPVTISVVEPLSIWIAGTQYNLDANTPQTVLSDQRGNLTISTVATSLHTAELTFSSPSLAQSYSIYPAQIAQNTLANAAQNPSTLQTANAQTQGYPNPTSAPLTTASSATVASAASVISDTFTIKSNANISPGTNLEMSLSKPKAVTKNTASAGKASLATSVGDFWNDLENYPEDVYHAVRTGILKIETVAVDIASQALSITLSLENLGTQVLNFVIHTIHDVASALQTAFAFIGAEVQKAIDWLKELFDWQDILNTKKVTEFVVAQYLTNLQNSLSPTSSLGTLLNENMGILKNTINKAFENAESVFGQSTITSQVSSSPFDPQVGNGPLDGSSVQGGFSNNQSKCNYVHAKTQTYVSQGGTFSGAASSGYTGSIVSALEQILSPATFSPVCTQLQAQLSANLHNPRNLFDMGICAIFDIFQDLIDLALNVLESVFNALLTLASDAIGAFQGMMTQTINIPVISWLYQQISGAPLCLLDLLSLILAAPATIIYKLVFGAGDPPFSPSDVQSILAGTVPWPAIGTQQQLQPETAIPWNTKLLSILAMTASIVYGYFDVTSDLAAYATMGQPFTKPNPIDTFVSASSLFSMAAITGYGAPITAINKPESQRNGGDNITLALWGVNWVVVAVNIAFLVDQRCKAEFTDYGLPFTIMFGCLETILGLTACFEYADSGSGYPPATSAQVMITPIPSVGKSLLYLEDPIALGVLVGGDIACDVTSGVLGVVSTYAPA